MNACSSARGTGARGRRAIVAMMMMMARARAGAEAFGIARVDSTNRAFVDGLTARRLTARGANAYSLRYDWLGNAKEKEKAEKTMDDAIALGIDVIRTWAFMDGDESSFDGRAMQPRRGEFVEKNFVALDEILARARGKVRFILTLTNHWEDYGGIDRYVRWAKESGDAPEIHRREDFYSSPTCRKYFEDFIRKIVDRVNTATGEHYRDDPSIFSYQLINEPRISGDAKGDVFHAWSTHFVQFIKDFDRGNHLVSVGTEGFFIEGDGSDLNPFNGAERQGVDMTRLLGSSVDFACVHVWADDWMDSDDESKFRFLDRWVREHLQRATRARKPVIFEEFGKKRPIAVRDMFFNRVFELLRVEDTDRSSGALFWLFAPDEVPDYDGFTVRSPSDSSTLDIVRREIASMREFVENRSSRDDSGTVSPPLAPPPPSPMSMPSSRDPDGEDDDDFVDFESDGGDDDDPSNESWSTQDDVAVRTSGVVLSYQCRMISSNALEGHATYGDHVSIELAIESTRELDVRVQFIDDAREKMTLTSLKTISSSSSTTSETISTTHVVTRRLGDGGVYVKEGPMKFRVFLSVADSATEVFVLDAVTMGTTIVFDSAAPFVVDAFLRPYRSTVDGTLSFTVNYGDVAVLFVSFSEPVTPPEVVMNGRLAFISVASSLGDAYYAYVEITRGVDAPGTELTFEIVSALDRAGNRCFTCENAPVRTTDASSLRVVDG